MVSGWMRVDEPKDMERLLIRALNKVLSSNDYINHCGKIASVANAWVNCRRLRLDSEEIVKINERLSQLEKMQSEVKR
jgi:calcineurin-like phosphoesterase family protein